MNNNRWIAFGFTLMLLASAVSIGMGGAFVDEVAADNVCRVGAGTREDPIMIHDVHELQAIRDNLTAHYALADHIDASETEGWNDGAGFEPVGTSLRNDPSLRFTGTLDGRGHRITDLYINRPSMDYVGLFGFTGREAELHNLILVDHRVTGRYQVGGLVGINGGKVENLYADGNVSGNELVGGLLGTNGNWVSKSYTAGNVSATGWYVGGLVGLNSGTVSNTYSTGNVSGSSRVGGLIGHNWWNEATVSNSYATGNVNGDAAVGGLVGNNRGDIFGSFYHENMPECAAYGQGSWPLNDDQFNSISTFESSGWDIEMVETGRQKPYLSWEADGGNSTWQIRESYVTYELNIVVEGNGTTVPPPGTNTFYEHGNIVIEAVPGPQHFFVGWSGDIDTKEQVISVNMDGDKNITAHFQEIDTEIYNWEHLYNIHRALSGRHILMADLDETTIGYDEYVDSEHGWLPIGDDDEPFTGEFHGEGFSISDLKVNRYGTDHVGLFGYTDDAKLTNVSLVDIDVSGSRYVGGLVGRNGGMVENSYAAGEVSGDNAVGGLVGMNSEGTVLNSYSTGKVSGSGNSIGGLVGLNGQWFDMLTGIVSDSFSTGNVSGNWFVGGLVGMNSEGTVSNSYSTGNVSGERSVGGLVGYNEWQGAVSNTYATGYVSGNITVGGLVGENSGMVNESYSTGYVSGDRDVGGLVGGNSGTVSRSYATGTVIGNESVGGLVGENGDTIENSYATGNVIGSSSVGGLVGVNEGTVNDSYVTGDVSGDRDVGGLVGENKGTVSNSFYNIDTVLINQGHHITFGGIFDDQFEDWLNNGLYLDIGDYGDTLPLIDDHHMISSTDGLRDLLGFADREGYKYRLAADIDLSGEPGLYVPYLAGDFDGSHHIISNLHIDNPFSRYVGMFGYVSGGIVMNLGVTEVHVRGFGSVGGLAGLNNGTMLNTFTTGNMSGLDDAVGGLLGWNSGTLSRSYSNVELSGRSWVGGLVGYNHGVVENTYATGAVNGNESVGGLVGWNYGTVLNSYAAVHLTGDQRVGGLVGDNFGGNVERSFWDIDTSGTDVSHEGLGKTTAEMMDMTTFVDWDIVGVLDPEDRDTDHLWNIFDGSSYPFLSWQEAVDIDLTNLIIDVEGDGSTDPTEGTHTYVQGNEVTVTAIPADGWYFLGWTGDLESTEEQITVTMDGHMEVTAVFREVIPPTVVITSPLHGATLDTSDVTVEWTSEPGTFSILYHEIQLNLGAWIRIDNATEYTFEELENGEYNVTVRAIDIYDKYHEDNVYFYVELPEPEFVPGNPELDVTPMDGYAPLEVTITISADNMGGAEDGIELMVNNSTIYNLNIPAYGSAGHNQTYTFEEPGTYEIRFGELSKNVTVEDGTGDGTTSGLGMLMWVIPLVAIAVIVLALVLIMRKKGGADTVPLDAEDEFVDDTDIEDDPEEDDLSEDENLV